MGTEQKMLYFSEEFAWLKERSQEAAFTIICAPSGYGKTIALRSITGAFKGKIFRINLYRSRPQDFYEEFCQTILKRACSISVISDLIQKGLPRNKEDADLFLDCLKDVCDEEPCFIAIDDYCRVEKPEYTEFLYYIANELRDRLQIVLAASHIDLTNLKEELARGEIFYITKDDLRLREKDILPYFLVNGMEISPEEASLVYEESEGWYAMLYVILRNYCITGKLSGYDDRSLLDMMRHNYLLLPQECKRFLNRIFPARVFTREAGIFLAGGGENAELLFDYTLDKAGFVFYDPEQELYHFHPLYRKMIQIAFSNLAGDEQHAIYKRYEAWKREHFIDSARPDLLTVFNEGSPKELEDKVDSLGIENMLDKEQLKQMLLFFQKKEAEEEGKEG